MRVERLVEEALAVAAGSGRTRCRRRSRPFTPSRLTPQRRIGDRSSGCTTCCCAPIPRRSSSSIARWRSRCATVRRLGLALIDDDSRARRADRVLPRALGARGSVSSAWSHAMTRSRRIERALSLTRQEPERRFLERRLRALSRWNPVESAFSASSQFRKARPGLDATTRESCFSY